MSELVIVFNLIHWFTALLLFALSVYSFRFRKKKPARALAYIFFLIGYWALFAALIFHVDDLAAKTLLNRLKLLAPPFIPLATLYLASALDHERNLPKWVWIALFVVPSVTGMVTLSPSYELFVGNYGIQSAPTFRLLTFQNGPWFAVHNFHSRVIMVLALFLLVTSNQKLNTHYRIRIWLVVVSLLVPLIADTMSLWLWEQLRFLQITPALSLFTALLMVYAVLRHHILDIVPMARIQILDSTNDLYAVFDEENCLVDFNKPAGLILGLKESSLGISIDKIFSTEFSKNRQIALGERTYDFSRKAIVSHLNQELGTLLHFKDVTEQKKVEQELEQISRMKTNFLAIMGHDIIGNLSAVSIMIENFRRDLGRESLDDQAAMLDNMQHCTQNCSAFIDDLLFWSKSQFGLLQPRYRVLDIESLMRDVILFNQHGIVHKNLEVSVEPNRIQSLVSDYNMLVVVLRNLVGNAVKFAPNDGRISITFLEEPERFLVSVEDSGCGVAVERRANLFSPEGAKANGLGLILCHEFIKLIGGFIWAEHRPGLGGLFHFSLPKTQLPTT